MVNLKEKLNICKKIYDEATKLDTNVIYNMNFIYSHDYGETVEMISEYVREIFEDLLKFQESKDDNLNLDSFTGNFKIIDGKVLLECDTLKNMIDVCFIAEKMAEFRKLKICKYCKTPFIAKNAKSEYDSIKCKNK